MLRGFIKLLLILLISINGGEVLAQEFPSKPVTLIVPFWAGGTHDLHARIMTRIIPKYLGQTMIVKLMPGAAGQRATSAAIRARADGHTIYFTHNYIDQLQQHIEYLPYDTTSDLVTVARINYAPICILVQADSPYKTLKQLLEYARNNPGMLTLAHSGNWNAQFVPSLRILLQSEAHMSFVPYQGGGPAIQAMLAGDVDVASAFPSVALPLAEAGKIRILANAGEERLLPDVPTLKELGFDDDVGLMQRIVMAPRAIPADRLQRLRDAFDKMNDDEDYNRMINQLGENTEYLDGTAYEELRPVQGKNFKAFIEAL
jgi:tripartite-type tricarboxylate transporter receptor subunit TctC